MSGLKILENLGKVMVRNPCATRVLAPILILPVALGVMSKGIGQMTLEIAKAALSSVAIILTAGQWQTPRKYLKEFSKRFKEGVEVTIVGFAGVLLSPLVVAWIMKDPGSIGIGMKYLKC